MQELIYNTKVLSEALLLATKSLNSYVVGNRKEIHKIEESLQQVDKQLIAKMTNSPATEIIDYLSKVVELKLKIEELKIRKGTSIINILKSWAPFIIPLLGCVLTSDLLTSEEFIKIPSRKPDACLFQGKIHLFH